MKPLGIQPKNPNKSYSQKLIALLEERQCIDEDDVQLVSRLQRKTRGKPFSSILVDIGIEEEVVQQAVADICGLGFSKLTMENTHLELVHKLGLGWCKDHDVLPIRIEDKVFIASATVDELFLTDDICNEIAEPVGRLLATHRDIQNILEELAQDSATLDAGDEILYEESVSRQVDLQEEANDAESSPVVRFVGEMITTAVREDASDIHFEASEEFSCARYRIDGVLHDLKQCSNNIHNAVVSRLKILANLDIAERRIPQDGRIRATVMGRKIDLRMSTVPTPKGEKVVLRLLDDRNIRIGLDELGFRKEALQAWKHEIESPHGIILVTGPTGCGKTTTLY